MLYARYPSRVLEHTKIHSGMVILIAWSSMWLAGSGCRPVQKESLVLQRYRRQRDHSPCLDKRWFERHRERKISRLHHVRREATQHDCLRFRESIRFRNIAGSQRFTKSWFLDSSWVLWEMNADNTTTNQHFSESSNAWIVKLAYLTTRLDDIRHSTRRVRTRHQT